MTPEDYVRANLTHDALEVFEGIVAGRAKDQANSVEVFDRDGNSLGRVPVLGGEKQKEVDRLRAELDVEVKRLIEILKENAALKDHIKRLANELRHWIWKLEREANRASMDVKAAKSLVGE